MTVSLLRMFYPLYESTLATSYEAHGNDVANAVAEITRSAIVSEDYTSVIEHCLHVLEKSPRVLYIRVLKRDGFSLIHKKDHWSMDQLNPDQLPPSMLPKFILKNASIESPEVFETTLPVRHIMTDWGWIVVGLSTDQYRADLHAVIVKSAISTGFCLLFCIGLALVYSRRLAGSLLSLVRTTEKVRAGNLEARADVRTGDEIEMLAHSFNEMTDSLRLTNAQLVDAKDSAEHAARIKSEFLANMSHEIRTPMNGVIGMAMLLGRTQLDARQQKYLGVIKSSADGLLVVINDILDFSKIEAGKLQLESIEFPLVPEIDLIAKMLAPRVYEKELEFAYSIDPRLPSSVVGDPARLRQILINLLGNAIKFTNEGEVLMSVELECQSGQPDHIRFSVRDTGIGIPKDRQQEIFNAFSQADGSMSRVYGGTGLGLSISSKLVELMSGRLEVESVEGLGSHFWFSIPLQHSKATVSIEEQHASCVDFQGMKVLIIDDHESNRCILLDQLEELGCSGRGAKDGMDGILALSSAFESGMPFDLVLVDYKMPRMDGVQFAEHIHNSKFKLPIILVSSREYLDSSNPARRGIHGIEAILVKPVSTLELGRTMAAINKFKFNLNSIKIPPAANQTQPAGKLNGVSVLLVEDNEINRELALEILEQAGTKVELAENGKVAIAMFQPGKYDCILMDCQMPVMNGFDATREIRAMESPGSHTPIIALTAHAFAEQKAQCLEHGMDDFLSKPVNPDTVLNLVSKWSRKNGQLKCGKPPEAISSSNGDRPDFKTFDLNAVTRLCRKNTSLVERLLRMMRESLDDYYANLLSGLENQDPNAIQEEAHKAKGAAKTICAGQLAELYFQLESAGRNRDLTEVGSLLDDLLEAMEYYKSEIDSLDPARLKVQH